MGATIAELLRARADACSFATMTQGRSGERGFRGDAGAHARRLVRMTRRGLSLAAFCACTFATLPTRAQPLIVIDAGHGGADPGAVGCMLEEEDVVLDVALRLRTLLEAGGLRVALTRDMDEDVGLSARASFANAMSADGFVSIHSNANGGTPASGTETFIANAAGARSLSLATLLQREMIAEWGLPDRGVKRADFVVVRDTAMPAALTELAFTNRCDPDAMLLGNPDERQAMAGAKARAVFEWLGVTPSLDGTLRGVVFADQGVGTMDLSVRLPGAAVRVIETGATATAAASDGAWSFTLPPGTYTVEASAMGHVTASRTCDVTGGGTTWCSIGLFPSGAPGDAGVGDDAGVPDDAGAVGDAAITADAAATPPAKLEPAGCGCTVARGRDARGVLAMVALLGLVGALRRKRRARRAPFAAARVTAGLLALTTGCAGPAPSGEAAAPAIAASQADATLYATPGAPVRVLVARELVLVVDEGAGALSLTVPHLAPDGASLVVAPADHHALYAVSLDERAAYGTPSRPRLLCASPNCGYEPRFVDALHVATRTPEQSASALPGDAFALDGTSSQARLSARGGLAWIEGEHIVRVWLAGRVRALSARGDRLIRAELSPDARFVLVESLTEGLTLHRLADGARIALGAGSGPHFDAEGRALVFERTRDDGHALTASDVFLVELDAPTVVRPLAVSARLERSPSLARLDADGRGHAAWEREGAIVVAEIALR
jgi:N-acetylmuramoyl-L-alanine amidase